MHQAFSCVRFIRHVLTQKIAVLKSSIDDNHVNLKIFASSTELLFIYEATRTEHNRNSFIGRARLRMGARVSALRNE
jgi:hypothetical protein